MADARINFKFSPTGDPGDEIVFSYPINYSDYGPNVFNKIRWSRRSEDLRLYINDVLVQTFDIGSDTIATTSQDLRIGGRFVDSISDVAYGLDGWLDQLSIYVGDQISTNPVDGRAYCPYVTQGQIRKLVQNLTGLEHLEGETVEVQADGLPEESQTYVVTSATLVPALANKAAVVHVGLPFDGKIKLLKASEGNPAGTGQGKMRRIYLASLRVFRSLGFKIGIDEDHLDPVILGDASLPLYTGDLEKLPNTKWKKDEQLLIVQDKPQPLLLLSVISKNEVETP